MAEFVPGKLMNKKENAYEFICKQSRRRTLLSHEENNELIKLAQTGNRVAYNELLTLHQGLVSQRVNKYGNPSGIDPEDLQQEGTFGLERAIRNFKVELGWKFSTFAAPVIDQFIDRAVKMKSDLVKKPAGLQSKLIKAQRKFSQHIIDEGRPPTQAELSQLSDLTREELDQCYSLFMEPVSLSAPLGESEDFSLEDTISCQKETPSQSAHQSFDIQKIHSCLAQLQDRDRLFIQYRFGILDNEPKTRQQLAQKFAVSELEVQRWEKRVLVQIEELVDLDDLTYEFKTSRRKTAEEFQTQQAKKSVKKKDSFPSCELVWNKSQNRYICSCVSSVVELKSRKKIVCKTMWNNGKLVCACSHKQPVFEILGDYCSWSWSPAVNKFVCGCAKQRIVPKIIILSPVAEFMRGAVAIS